MASIWAEEMFEHNVRTGSKSGKLEIRLLRLWCRLMLSINSSTTSSPSVDGWLEQVGPEESHTSPNSDSFDLLCPRELISSMCSAVAGSMMVDCSAT